VLIREKMIDCRGDKSRLEVADDLGITKQMLGALERGDRNPSHCLAKRISDYYDASVDELFFTSSGHKTFPKYCNS